MTVLWSNLVVVWLGALRQTLMILLMNIPIISFGLSLAWVSLASGARAVEPQGAVVGGAGATHVATVIGVLISAAALKTGRKPPLIASSAIFAVCWGLKIHGSAWSIFVAGVLAGLAGAAAWTASPLMGREMSSGSIRGAATAAPVLAHNFGFLLMYAAADADISHHVILLCCLGVSLFHCLVFFFVPESPSFLAASGKLKQAHASLAWLRGISADSLELTREAESLPPKEDSTETSLILVKEIWKDRQRRRALILSVIAVAAQECSGLLALMQFAEQVFAKASGDATSPARQALILGAVQLVASAVALYLVERIGRRPLIVWTALACGGFLLAGTAISWVGGSTTWLAVALGGAVAADSLGMNPAPYALLADMFHYRYRGCALLIATAAGAAGNAIEVAIFGAAASAGMHAALGLAAVLTITFALFAIFALPETRNKSPEEIYDVICPRKEKSKDINQNLDPKDLVVDTKAKNRTKSNDKDEFYNIVYMKENKNRTERNKLSNSLSEISKSNEPNSEKSNEAVIDLTKKDEELTQKASQLTTSCQLDEAVSDYKSNDKISNNTDNVNKSDCVVTVLSDISDKETQWTSL